MLVEGGVARKARTCWAELIPTYQRGRGAMAIYGEGEGSKIPKRIGRPCFLPSSRWSSYH